MKKRYFRTLQHAIEQLEQRRNLSASPELVFDINTDPAPLAKESSFFWETDADRIVWIQEGFSTGHPDAVVTEVHRLDHAIDDTLATTIDGELKDYFFAEGRLFLEVSSDGDSSFKWSTDGTVDNTQFVGESTLSVVNRDGRVTLSRSNDQPYELWWNDSVTGARVMLASIADSTFPPSFTPIEVGDKLFLRLEAESVEIWVTDGTAEGTYALPDASGSDVTDLVVFQNRLIYSVSAGQGDRTIWVTDGTIEGTRQIVNADGERLNGSTKVYTASDNLLFGSTMRTDGGFDYWVADESLVPRSAFATFAAPPTNPAVAGQLFEFTIISDSGTEHWTTDGTATGTRRLAPNTLATYQLSKDRFELIRDEDSVQLWVTSGKDEQQLLNPALGPNTRFIDEEDGNVYFASRDELWASDGTVEGTNFATKIIDSDQIQSGVVAGSTVALFDGSDVWTAQIGDPTPGLAVDNALTKSASPRLLGNADGKSLYLTGTGPPTALWVTDGTQFGTTWLLNLGGRERIESSTMTIDGWTYFVLRNSTANANLMRTQGTSATTESVAALPAGFVQMKNVDGKLFMFIQAVREDGGWSSEDGSQLWVSDGTERGTRMVRDELQHWVSPLGAQNGLPAVFRGRLYFPTFNNLCTGCELWESDGSFDGTRAVELPGNSSRPRGLQAVGDNLFFVVDIVEDGSFGHEVFFLDSDRKVHQTGIRLAPMVSMRSGEISNEYAIIYDGFIDASPTTFVTRTAGTNSETFDLERRISSDSRWFADGKIFFSIRNEQFQKEFYSTDGTAEGAQLFFRESREWVVEVTSDGAQRLTSSRNGDTVQDFTPDESYVYLTTDQAIWRSDGTPENTVKLADLDSMELPRHFAGINPVGEDLILLNGQSGIYGEELFRISKTPEPLVGDIDRDWDVDFADFLAVSANFGKQVDVAFPDGDANGDGEVNFADFLLVSAHFGENLTRHS